MTRGATVLTFILLLFSVKCASADTYDDCKDECTKVQAQCVEGITLYDTTGVQEAKNACAKADGDCITKCHGEEELGEEGYRLKLKNEADDAEKKRQEQEVETNGGINILNLDK